MEDPDREEFEELCAEIHALYQAECRRQGMEPHHPDDYYALSEETKEFDRVIARWHLQRGGHA